nr:HAMP domain-containing histidine kinase [Candidatus Thioglobus sp.]
MIKAIKLTKYIAIMFITLSVVSITGYFVQQIKDNTKSDLRSYSKDKDQLIDELTTQLLRTYENHVSYQETELGTFLESLDLKNKQKSIISLQKEIDLLESRVQEERLYVDAISLSLIATASLIFIILIYIIKKRNRNKNEWIHSLAHQLQNSIAPITISISNLKLNLSEEDRKKTLNILFLESKKLRNLTEKMLQLFSYTKIRESNIKDSEEELNLELLINKIISNSKLSSNKKNLSVSCHSQIEQPYILGDKILIEQLFGNLINNAIGFSYPNGEISIQIYKSVRFIIIEVVDHGIGIQDKNKVLTDGVVYPTIKIDEDKGHGLGLKLVRRIVKLHNGEFDINNNKEDKGVT